MNETEEEKEARMNWIETNGHSQIELQPFLREYAEIEKKLIEILDGYKDCKGQLDFVCLFASADYRALPKLNRQKSSV